MPTVINTPTYRFDFTKISNRSPGFFAARKRGEFIKPLPFFQESVSIDRPYGSGYFSTSTEDAWRGHYTFGQLVNQTDGVQHSWNIPIGTSIGADIAECEAKAYEKSRSREIDLGTFLGELPETIDFLTKSMVKVSKAFKYLRKKDPKSALRVLYKGQSPQGLQRLKPPKNALEGLTEIAGLWLSVQYAIRPLIGDVYSACQVYEKGYRDPYRIFSVQHSVRRSINVTKGWPKGPGTGTNVDAYIGSYSVSHKFYLRVSCPVLYTLEQVGLTNPASVAWELVPFSFVIDWFIPVGKFLQDLAPPRGLELIRRYQYVKWDGVLNARSSHSTGNGDYWNGSMSMIRREVHKNRTISDAWPVPTSPLENINVPEKWQQLASGASLLLVNSKKLRASLS